jgi:hypothetical protein
MLRQPVPTAECCDRAASRLPHSGWPGESPESWAQALPPALVGAAVVSRRRVGEPGSAAVRSRAWYASDAWHAVHAAWRRHVPGCGARKHCAARARGGLCGSSAWRSRAAALSRAWLFPVCGARVSTPCARRRIACGRAWLRAWLPSDVCARASILPWQCARAAWQLPPAVGLVPGALPVGPTVRCRSSSSLCLRSAKDFQCHTIVRCLPPRRTPPTYPQNVCITMWTESLRRSKRRAAARACVAMSEISPARVARRTCFSRSGRCSVWR